MLVLYVRNELIIPRPWPTYPNHFFPICETDDPQWYVDSGASTHLMKNPCKILNPTRVYNSTKVIVGKRDLLPITHASTSLLTTPDRTLLLSPVYCVPQLSRSFLSITELCRTNSCLIVFDGHSFCIKNKQTEKIVLKVKMLTDLYPI